MGRFVGREREIAALQGKRSPESGSRLTVVYGRRRIGKTRLIEEAFKGCEVFKIEGLEDASSRKQRQHFIEELAKFSGLQAHRSLRNDNWRTLLISLSEYIGTRALVVFLDEFQWLAAERNDLISELKFVWDNYFAKNNNVHLILCGSISSFIVKRVARSKAFYGRIDLQIHLKPLNLKEVQGGFFNNSTQREVVEHWMILGGVPWYLNLCDPSRTPEQNAKVLLFSNLGKLFRETEQLFVSHFGKNPAYQKVVEYLGVHRFSHRKPLVKAGGMKSGGGASDILEDLELAGFIESYSSIHLADSKRLVRYRLADPFLRFYYHFVAPLRKRIEREGEVDLPIALPPHKYASWRGVAFEHLCMQHIRYIAKALDFAAVGYQEGAYFGREDLERAVQVDLLIKRDDRVFVLCEIKYSENLGPQVITEVKRKIENFPNPKGYPIQPVLISAFGPGRSVREQGYFSKILGLDIFFTSL